jgi:DNA helicase-2/ATP-dependent DNA helicase PcrA
MATTIHKKVKSVIAGPGAGKTTGLVKEIIGRLPELAPYPYRHMAVITYTNAATDDIKEKLNKDCKVPSNVFIGTIHSFLNKFILIPFGSVYGLIPSNVHFIDNVVVTKGNNNIQRIIQERAITTRVIEKGAIPYEAIENLSKKLIDDKRIRRLVAIRLQMIFIDEYQDANTTQHHIFMEIQKEAKTALFTVGDPEQYIYGFRYKGKSKPVFNKIPILTTIDKGVVDRIEVNRRSSPTIVTFLNKFNTQLQQRSAFVTVRCEKKSKIYFINETDLSNVIAKFDSICCDCGLSRKCNRFYLAYNGKKTVKQLQSLGIPLLAKDGRSPENALSEVMRLITGVVGKSMKNICEEKKMSVIEVRKFGMKVFRKIRSAPQISVDELQDFISSLLGLAISKEHTMKDSIDKLIAFNNKPTESYKQCSTIHKAKGLEAHAVLVIAQTKAELLKWLETDKQKRCDHETDKCREGFVAFSRAKELL